ncbi:hydroxyethylthiazole kinase-like uncharacterized protein yjeF/hydroxyethylthiazole kinase-like uncharacterized protein yjeF [Tepidamorphus gemmatus]|uniref:Bifunctional NAD(P)H-hydrate repair enzyme n=1 Tax=Tepidamorphus gemmatus TaxID=747076 RepID=A0A4R3MCI7_9HYPH|nr:NAD(P)H-hydrate dehydratase [Tepidamorphus gemmatus]TCT11290.1 hydroxyethylthiazole kinase-like uncharacterized protein yjeF/hydroxyethylthiazole kinase-like uncharacterized protein yjeF [Tepidamorphus gemmatus]
MINDWKRDGRRSRVTEVNELLTTAEMAEADRLAIALGIPGIELMENAGRAVAAAALPLARGTEVLVMCGPGNNGGDGFVAARHLAAAGRKVRVMLLGEVGRLRGDAAVMAARWDGDVHLLGPDVPGAAGVVVDALFGAGLSKPVDGAAAAAIEAVNRSGLPVVAVDVPTGLDGSSGQVRGIAVRATRTVTFFRLKPGHLLMPGRDLCGEVRLADIGIPGSVLDDIRPSAFANRREIWAGRLCLGRRDIHKYDRGHVLVVGGDQWNTGAARLAARAALRAGAGLVTVASPTAALPVYASHLTSVMLRDGEGVEGVKAALADPRRNAVVIGPAAGVGDATRDKVCAVLAAGRSAVLDADALTSFEASPEQLFGAILSDRARPVVMTPHEGEFRRLFGSVVDMDADKLARARAAARLSGAVVLLKGTDTIVAAPDGKAWINDNAPEWLATAGSGDVLAGIVAALLARGLPAPLAAAAAAWLHGAAALRAGPGLIAEDLPEAIPSVLRELRN